MLRENIKNFAAVLEPAAVDQSGMRKSGHRFFV